MPGERECSGWARRTALLAGRMVWSLVPLWCVTLLAVWQIDVVMRNVSSVAQEATSVAAMAGAWDLGTWLGSVARRWGRAQQHRQGPDEAPRQDGWNAGNFTWWEVQLVAEMLYGRRDWSQLMRGGSAMLQMAVAAGR